MLTYRAGGHYQPATYTFTDFAELTDEEVRNLVIRCTDRDNSEYPLTIFHIDNGIKQLFVKDQLIKSFKGYFKPEVQFKGNQEEYWEIPLAWTAEELFNEAPNFDDQYSIDTPSIFELAQILEHTGKCPIANTEVVGRIRDILAHLLSDPFIEYNTELILVANDIRQLLTDNLKNEMTIIDTITAQTDLDKQNIRILKSLDQVNATKEACQKLLYLDNFKSTKPDDNGQIQDVDMNNQEDEEVQDDYLLVSRTTNQREDHRRQTRTASRQRSASSS